MTESSLQREITLILRHLGFFFLRINSGAAKGGKFKGAPAGTADIAMFPHHGLPIWIELKTATGKQSDLQQEFEAKVKFLGHRYFVVRSVDDLLTALAGVSR